MDDLRQQLAAAFAAEHAEHVAAIRAGLAAAEAGGAADLRDIFRRAHSLKGAARAVDRADIEQLADALETMLADLDPARPLDARTIDAARRLLDGIEDAVAEDEAEDAPAAEGDDLLRIGSRHVDRLAEQVRALQADLEARALIASDLRGTRAEIEAIRGLCLQPGANLGEIGARLTRLLAASNAIAARRIAADGQVERAAQRLAEEAEHILLAPAATLAEGQERIVRAIAGEEGKDAELVVTAEAAEADRRVLQALRDPLNHLLRNAIGHGIEPADVRARAGKPARARIGLTIRADAGRLLLSVEDDGPGPDVAAIVAAARARGALPAGDGEPDEIAALSLVFAYGVSTRGAVDRLSGRGVGLSVVADAVRRLDGGVRMMRGAGGVGTRVEISVPLALTRRPVMLVEAGGQVFAVPARAVSRAVRFAAARIETSGGLPVLPVTTKSGENKVLPVVSLAGLLGLPDAPLEPWVQALALRVDERTYMIRVDALVDLRPLSFGDADAIAADLPLVLGAAAIDEGRLALVLSPELLAERILHGGGMATAAIAPAAPARQQTILVVDDSITTRTLERGILEGQGYRVLLSVDGIDGLETLRRGAGEIDLVIADVEMPRMDGFGLLAGIRNDPVLADIPVVMMTSRNSPEDIQRGLDLGANAYVTKQEFEQGQLLATVGRLI